MASSLKPYDFTDDIGAIAGHTLGSDLSPHEAEWFITSGSPSKRNVLTTNEKVITRAINALNDTITGLVAQIEDFDATVSTVIGHVLTDDREAFEEVQEQLGSNLIQALRTVYSKVEEGAGSEDGGLTEDEIKEIAKEIIRQGLEEELNKLEIVTEEFTFGGNSTFELSNTPKNILEILIVSNKYVIALPEYGINERQLNIVSELNTGDVVRVQYQCIINV